MIKGNQFDFSTFTDKISVINNPFWDKIETIVPADWLTDQYDVIKTYLTTLINEADLFAHELNRILL